MALFGADPKDAMIDLLQEQLRQRDLRIAELEKLNLALTDKQAFALRYPREPRPVAEPKPVENMNEPYRPRLSRDELEKTFQS